ncbi:MAG: hypothetical protein K1X57_07170 [Gemmataceae bacterium]|nr:hypothetical protein [Gemmataceae bacterium]
MIATFGIVAALIAVVVGLELMTGGSLRLFGPVLFFEMVRSGRRGRYFAFRAVYALALFLLLLWVWTIWRSESNRMADDPRAMSYLAEIFFYAFAIVQFGAVCLLTPGYVAGCVAEDKERRTIDFILATDLANREIIFGKVAARIGNLIMFLLTGLPVLSIIQMFGGIDPAILLMTFAATACTMFGLVGISLVQSVQRRRVREAVVVTFLISVAYLFLSWFCWFAENVAANFREVAIARAVIAMEPVMKVIRWGDPVWVISEITQIISGVGARGEALLELLAKYASFHLFVFLAGLGYAVWKVRAIALRQAGSAPRKRKNVPRFRRRPAVSGSRPILWKEMWIERSFRLGVFGQVGMILLVVLSFLPMILAVYFFVTETAGRMSWREFQEFTAGWIVALSVLYGTAMIVGIGVRAAGAIGSERDRDTLISLLTTPLSAFEILAPKVWGAMLSVRVLGYWLSLAWVIGMVTGSVSPWGPLAFAVAFAPPALAAGVTGVALSVFASTTLRALLGTLAALLFGLGGHWCVGGMCCYIPAGFTGSFPLIENVLAFQVGATPPAMFYMIPFAAHDTPAFIREMKINYILTGSAGCLCWAVLALIVWLITFDRFAEMTNRGLPLEPRVAPEGAR